MIVALIASAGGLLFGERGLRNGAGAAAAAWH